MTMKMRKVTKLWVTQDGTKVRICDMSDDHLRNTIRMLERITERAMENVDPPSFQGEMAQFFADQEYNAMMSAGPDYLFPIYNDLVLEADRRRLILE